MLKYLKSLAGFSNTVSYSGCQVVYFPEWRHIPKPIQDYFQGLVTQNKSFENILQDIDNATFTGHLPFDTYTRSRMNGQVKSCFVKGVSDGVNYAKIIRK